MTQNEAIQISLGIATAMKNDDKVAREMLYEGLSEEELKRVLRWTTRFMLRMFTSWCQSSGVPEEALEHIWISWIAGITSAIEQQGDQP